MASSTWKELTEGTRGLECFSTTSGTITVDSSVVYTGRQRSLKLNTGNPAVTALARTAAGVLTDAGNRICGHFRYETAFAAASNICTFENSSSTTVLGLRINTSNQLILITGGPTTLGTGTTTLTTGTFHRVSIAYTITSTTVYSVRVYLDGNSTPEISVTNGTTLTGIGITTIAVNLQSTAGTDRILYWSDIYADNGNDLSMIEDINLNYKGPDEANATSFDTTGGTGAVNERPISETNYKQHAATTDVAQNWTLQTAAEGDLDISTKTIVAYTGFAWAKRGSITACTHRASAAGNTANPTTTDTITIPSSTATGDSLFVYLTSRDHTSGTAYPTVTDNDTGGNTWTRIAENNDGSRKSTLWWKRATSGTASKTITIAGCVGSMSSGVSVFQNAATSVTPYEDIVVEDNASANETHAGFTPTTTGASICFGVSNYNNDNSVSNVSGATIGTFGASGRYEKLSTGGSDCGNTIWSIDGSDISPPSTGAITWSQTNGVTTSISWSVRPEQSVGTPDITLNGTDYAKTLSATSALYTQIVTSASYPSNAAGIGMRSTNAAPDTFLYDCGVVIAWYTPEDLSVSANFSLLISSSTQNNKIANNILNSSIIINSVEKGQLLASGQEQSSLIINQIPSVFCQLNGRNTSNIIISDTINTNYIVLGKDSGELVINSINLINTILKGNDVSSIVINNASGFGISQQMSSNGTLVIDASSLTNRGLPITSVANLIINNSSAASFIGAINNNGVLKINSSESVNLIGVGYQNGTILINAVPFINLIGQARQSASLIISSLERCNYILKGINSGTIVINQSAAINRVRLISSLQQLVINATASALAILGPGEGGILSASASSLVQILSTINANKLANVSNVEMIIRINNAIDSIKQLLVNANASLKINSQTTTAKTTILQIFSIIKILSENAAIRGINVRSAGTIEIQSLAEAILASEIPGIIEGIILAFNSFINGVISYESFVKHLEDELSAINNVSETSQVKQGIADVVVIRRNINEQSTV